jgi:hypothetical protein
VSSRASTAWRHRARSLARNWHLALLVYLLLFLVAPFAPSYPQSGLDPSWQTGLNEAVVQHLDFGRDVLFAYGPYGVLDTGEYHPQLRWLGIVGGLVLAAGYAVAVVVLLRGRRRWVAVALSLGAMAGLASTDALCLLYPMLAALGVHRLVSEEPSLPAWWGHRAQLAVLAAPFGLLPLVKLSTAPVVLAGLVAASVLLLVRRHRLEAAAFWVVPLLTACVLWLVAGQSLGSMDDYVIDSLPIVSGYTQAMSKGGHGAQAVLVALASALVVLALLTATRLPIVERLVVTALVAATLFVSFKAALVRLDPHALIIVAPLIVTAVVAASYCRSWVVRVLLVLACVSVAMAMKTYWTMPVDPSLARSAERSLTAGPVGLAERVLDPALLDRRYAAALADIRHQDLVTRLRPGTDVDLYPYDISGVLARHVRWNPRPVFQSYSAFTPELARRNAEHLEGEGAPGTVLFGIGAIDSRLPALEDGSSWVPLLENYRITRYDALHDYLVMRHRQHPVPLDISGHPVRVKGTLGTRMLLPAVGSPGQGWLATFDVRPTLKGRLAETFWKTAPMLITLTLEDGSIKKYVFIPRMAQSRFLLSPLVLNPRNMAGLVFPGGGSAGAATPPAIRAVLLEARGADGLWKTGYSIDLTAVRLPISSGRG